MHKAALKLFLEECVATTLKNEIELEGTLASALQIRHKIRDVDLKKLFDLADEARPLSIRRHYYAYTLQMFAGSAYSTLRPVISAPIGKLADAMVKPHWDPNKLHKFGAIYDAEPMNLFPGWSLTNTRNNRNMLDPHLLTLHSDGAISTDLHGEVSSSSLTRTIGMQISAKLHPEDERATESRLRGNDLPGLEKAYSPYSEKLKKNEDEMKNTLAKRRGTESRAYDTSQMLKKFEKILSAMKKSTLAGSNHYRLLFDNLIIQDLTSDILLLAKSYWARHRTAVEAEIDQVIKYLRARDGSEYATTLPHYEER